MRTETVCSKREATMLKFYHSPHSRSSGIHWLLEELGVPYETEIVNFRAPGGVPESYRAVHPHKKVPAIAHDGVTITERAAIATYLADAFPEAGLAPRIGDKARGPYLTWLVYSDSVYDPALAARIEGWKYSPSDFSFGSFEDMIRNVERRLTESPYIAGETFTAADTQVATGIGWAMHAFESFPKLPAFLAYLERMQTRPAYQRYFAKESA
jgi:glutathione S-transferase